MAEPIREVEVRVKVPLDVYLSIESKATRSGIGAGRLIAEFLIASIRASRTGAPTFVIRKVKPRPVSAIGSGGRRSYVRITDADLPSLRKMVAANATLGEIAARFGISQASAFNWRRKILAEEPAAA